MFAYLNITPRTGSGKPFWLPERLASSTPWGTTQRNVSQGGGFVGACRAVGKKFHGADPGSPFDPRREFCRATPDLFRGRSISPSARPAAGSRTRPFKKGKEDES
jgi:hypothetical protein